MKMIFKKNKIKLSLLIATLLTPLTLTYADTVYENASDGNTNGWHIYDKWPSGAKVENISDTQRGKVIKITGTTSNGVSLLGWKDTNSLIQWKMKASEWNIFYVAAMTTNGFRYLSYTPRGHDKGRDPYNQSHKIRLGIGSKMKDGKWHTFTRNIQADITKHEPGNQLKYIQGIKVRGAGSYDDIKTIPLTTPAPTKKKEIFIIGPSTVHIGNEWNSQRNLECKDNNPTNILMGWAEKFQEYSNSKVYDFARLGSNPISFYDAEYDENLYGLNQNWDSTYNAMQKAPEGSFLLIQFGGNSKRARLDEETFKASIRRYIDKAEKLKIIPVLITALDAHDTYPEPKRYPYGKYMRELANENNKILLLDLLEKSNEEFKKLNQQELDKFGDCIHEGKRDKDPIHLSPNGANIVAGWVKDLACQSDRIDGKELCSQFK